jgi:hypothetical protein
MSTLLSGSETFRIAAQAVGAAADAAMATVVRTHGGGVLKEAVNWNEGGHRLVGDNDSICATCWQLNIFG